LILSIDLETRSPVDLKRSGAYRYFENPYTEILCAAWAIDDGPVSVWLPGEYCPYELGEAIMLGAEISAWNVNFERQGFNHKLGPKHGWPVPQFEQFRDTAAQAAAQALPRRLEKAAQVLRMPEQKDLAGSKLMMQMARPRKRHKDEDEKPIYWFEGDIRRLADYCKQDVEVERAIRNRLQPLSDSEMALWRFDQLINERGITLDIGLVNDMMAIVTEHAANLDQRIRDITGGLVYRCSQTERLKDFLRTHGVNADSLAKTAIETVLAQDMPKFCRIAILLWQEASRASVRKLQAARLCVGGDDRAHGLLLFHGATSGRWAGQLFQPQNLPRGSGLVTDQDAAIAMMQHRNVHMLHEYIGDPLTVISDCLRGIMTAGPGKTLVAGDYANIEARITAWLAGADAKLEAFRQQDAGTGHEIYRLAASAIYHTPVDSVTATQRQTGKTAELALGFGGGVDALARMALNYRIDMSEAWQPLWDAASPEDRELAGKRFAEVFAKGNNDWLPQKAWQACWFIVRAWRRANQPIVDMWDQFHRAAWQTLEESGKDIVAGKISFKRQGGFLWLTLPSGRKLAYPTPAVENLEVPWSDKRKPAKERERRDMLTVLAFEKNQPMRYAFYPGLTFQHSVQAIARDILAAGMTNVEAAGYPVVMSIHDEVISEVPPQAANVDDFTAKLCVLPDWAAGLPLVAEGWSGFRYRKA
jgi:DNA polymerase